MVRSKCQNVYRPTNSEGPFWCLYSLFAGEPIPGLPATTSGRLASVAVMFMGLLVFAALVGTISAFMVERLASGLRRHPPGVTCRNRLPSAPDSPPNPRRLGQHKDESEGEGYSWKPVVGPDSRPQRVGTYWFDTLQPDCLPRKVAHDVPGGPTSLCSRDDRLPGSMNVPRAVILRRDSHAG